MKESSIAQPTGRPSAQPLRRHKWQYTDQPIELLALDVEGIGGMSASVCYCEYRVLLCICEKGR